MKTWYISGIIIAMLIASGCVGEKTQQEQEDIKIGVLITYTGGLGPIGEGMANGAKLAAMEINNKGIIKGKNITLIIEDTETDPAKAAEAARKLIDIDKVQVIIGGVSSSETLAIAPYAEKSKVVMISPSSTNPKITEAGEYIFRVVPSDLLQGEAIAKLALAKNYAKAVMLVENNDYGILLDAKSNSIQRLYPPKALINIFHFEYHCSPLLFLSLIRPSGLYMMNNINNRPMIIIRRLDGSTGRST